MKAMRLLLLTVGIGGLWTAACSSGPPIESIEQPLCNCNVEDPPCCCESPILIDVAGDGVRLTSWTDGVEFAPRPGFRPSARAWTEPNSDDAWLVLDRDGNGVINDGSEMFGNSTPQPQPAAGTLRNGFLALAQYDDDGNGSIDEHDAIFSELRLWQDSDHDGVSQPLELHTLTELGVAGISLAYVEDREVDQHGNSFRYKSAVYGTPGSPVGMTAWDVWLVGAVPEPATRSRAPVQQASDADADAGGCGGDEPDATIWTCNVKCQLAPAPANVAAPCSGFITGRGTGPSEQEACLAAKQDANSRVPRHCYKRHCKCRCFKGREP